MLQNQAENQLEQQNRRLHESNVQLQQSRDALELHVSRRTAELNEALERAEFATQASQRAFRILDAVSELQRAFISGTRQTSLFRGVVDNSLELTCSKFGLVGEVLYDEDDQPYLRTFHVTNIAWDAESEPQYDDDAQIAMEFHSLDTLFGAVITSREVVISNDPASDPRSGGAPPGHPVVEAFMGVPLISAGDLVGVLAVANRPGGYTLDVVREIKPLCAMIAQLITATRNEEQRKDAEEQVRLMVKALVEQRTRLENAANELEEKNRELEESQRVTEEARQAAELAAEAKGQFLANMSHEIRTPMTAILGFADVLLGEDGLDKAPPTRVAALETIKRNGEHLLNVINDILDLSKIEAGKFEIEHIMCSPHEILNDVQTLMQVRADAKNLQWIVELDGPLPIDVKTDPTRLRQILINLVGNAFKFTAEGAVRLKTRAEPSGTGTKLIFDVADTGIGMTDTQLQFLFQPFQQADNSMSRKFGGTGLGLTISKRFAELLGGDINVRSEIGRGSVFSLAIDVGVLEGSGVSDQLTPATTHQVEPVRRNEKPLRGCRILLVEDGPDNQRLISFVLKKAGADVTVAEDGLIGRNLALEAVGLNATFDIVLMDMQMPVMDGYTSTRQLRERDYTGCIIALTAHAMVQDRQRCLDAGCDEFTTKPIKPVPFISLISDMFHGD